MMKLEVETKNSICFKDEKTGELTAFSSIDGVIHAMKCEEDCGGLHIRMIPESAIRLNYWSYVRAIKIPAHDSKEIANIKDVVRMVTNKFSKSDEDSPIMIKGKAVNAYFSKAPDKEVLNEIIGNHGKTPILTFDGNCTHETIKSYGDIKTFEKAVDNCLESYIGLPLSHKGPNSNDVFIYDSIYSKLKEAFMSEGRKVFTENKDDNDGSHESLNEPEYGRTVIKESDCDTFKSKTFYSKSDYPVHSDFKSICEYIEVSEISDSARIYQIHTPDDNVMYKRVYKNYDGEIEVDDIKSILLYNRYIDNPSKLLQEWVDEESKHQDLYHGKFHCLVSDIMKSFIDSNVSYITYEGPSALDDALEDVLFVHINYPGETKKYEIARYTRDTALVASNAPIYGSIKGNCNMDNYSTAYYGVWKYYMKTKRLTDLFNIIDAWVGESRATDIKYIIDYTDSKLVKGGRCDKVYRIIALKEFVKNDGFIVRVGDIGGYVSGYNNLSQSGKSWIDAESIVCKSASIEGNALVKQSVISSSTGRQITGNVFIGKCTLSDTTILSDYDGYVTTLVNVTMANSTIRACDTNIIIKGTHRSTVLMNGAYILNKEDLKIIDADDGRHMFFSSCTNRHDYKHIVISR